MTRFLLFLFCSLVFLQQARAAEVFGPVYYPQAPLSGVLASDFAKESGIKNAAAIQGFYDQRGQKPYWTGKEGPSLEAVKFILLLRDSWQHGLNPKLYHTEEIKRLRETPGPLTEWQLEALLTDAFILYTQDMSGMRVSAASLGLNAADWQQPYTAEQCIRFLQAEKDITKFLDALPPASRTYRALQAELIRLSTQPEEPYAKVLPISFGGKLLKPGQRHARIPDLRLRLNAPQQGEDALLYDDILEGFVVKFQRASGLNDDGVVGETTLKLLNRSNADKIKQIVANLERLRWIGREKPERFVIVNIPSASLWAVEKGNIALQMPVVVGKPERATQSFITNITGVRFNPDWTVPPTIKKKDILPKLRENPYYLADKGMELVMVNAKGRRETIDPGSIDWDDISSGELARISMVQTPGAHNPLGNIRVLMPNKYDIYLHDTNHKEHFGRNQRAQSSGCVRMKNPRGMADFLLQPEKGWSAAKSDQALEAGRTRDVMLSKTLPVYIVYYTMWVDANGNVTYGNDIYNLDKVLVGQIEKVDGFSFPGHNDRVMPIQGDTSR
ncbi:MAG: L,D-transpeptidase family protein [Alphaproteobacteria bacterium]|nr:L,D-transpeptidase family protein [Alphaproteobacteria bacterium]